MSRRYTPARGEQPRWTSGRGSNGGSIALLESGYDRKPAFERGGLVRELG
jgi:hypothetical protein